MAGDGWRKVISDAVTARAAHTAANHRGASDQNRISRVGFAVDAHVFLVRAAKRRKISLSGYIRRATMAQVAADLGMDPRELFELDAAITPIGRRGSTPTKDLDGELYGLWGCQGDTAGAGER
jgi:hypothetical protein